MAKEVIMPALGMAQETGSVVQWLKAEGEAVAKDEPLMISGVAIMADTDNTGESATAYYGDILFRKVRH